MSFGKITSLWLAVVFVVCSVSVSVAQDKESPFATNILGTLSNPKMAAELELLDDQKDSIKQLMNEFGQIRNEVGESMKEEWEAASDEHRKELGKEYWRRIEEGRLDIVKQIKANLLPHQIDRVEQLSAQRMMTEGKGRESAGLLSDPMISYLEINDTQRQRIQEKSDRLKKEVGEKIRKILEDAKLELLAELTSKQKKKYEKLVGEPIVEESSDDKPSRKRGG